MYSEGQGILGKLKFKDGTMPLYDRTYLIISVSKDNIGVLNVSSTIGKESKLLYPTNKRLTKYNPPFLKDSFVKLDSLMYVDIKDIKKCRILHKGDCLDNTELMEIINTIKTF